ncbi:hypothetical protein E4U46_000439 [Claviceps purpurea]|nr:hypothetical protein E4U46_000439 [Claviceps purpurea]
MARKLPWASPRNANTTTSAPATPLPNLLARQISPHGHASHTPQTCPPATGPPRARSSSITPPPEPPPEQFMIPLLDDKYRMVEDELLHTAQQYTTHLHRAEYIRLKAVISSRNAHTIREMERPVVPGSGGSTPRGRAVRVRRKIVEGKQAVLMGEEAPWMGTSLQGLMEKGEKGGEGDRDGKGGGGRDGSLGRVVGDVSIGRVVGDGSFGRVVGDGSLGRVVGDGSLGRVVGDGSLGRVDGEDGLKTRAVAGCTNGGGRERSRTMPSYEGVSGGGSEERSLRRDGDWRMERRKRVKEEEEGGYEEEEQKEEDSDDDDDPFGVKRRRARRVQSREQMKRGDRGRPGRERERNREMEKDRSREREKGRDVMPSFL